ncbi:unnamed protein product [Psylliodes chrysocephalus]|uniref:Saposin B-type domain-containing protein n=1 Tax=Psylliodes chrysocephalus TaxID=3402493 RepID=A0A9P0D3A0_9CUCU|nr:unnamed protein product [Psylliodes chrysocephala]
MRLKSSLISIFLVFVIFSRSETAHGKRISKRSFLIGLISNKTRSAVQKLGEISNFGAEKIGNFSAAVVKPISSNAAGGIGKLGDKTGNALEVVGNRTAHVAGKSVQAVETVAEKAINFTFSDIEIHDIERSFAHRMGLKYNKDTDIQKVRNLLGGLFDPSTKFLDSDRTTCGLCKFLIAGLQRHSFTVAKVGEFICNIYILLATYTVSDFCKSIIELNRPVLTYVFDNSKILDPELACTILLQTKECTYDKPALQWVTLVSSTAPIYPEVSHDSNEKPMTILHLTDFHITPDYEVGGVSNCGYPVCCKKGLGNSLKGEKASKWGDYNCDIPPWLLGATLQHLNHTYKDVEIVYFTGDIIDHTVWNTSVESNTEMIYYTYKALAESFPKAKIFSVIGNHESNPLNVFSPPFPDIIKKGLSTDWLYELMGKVWRPWLSPQALETVKYQGYYAQTVSPRLKVIGLNNNVCYNFNWWLMYHTEYINEQLQFLNKELEESEKNGQFVHILGHVSVGNQECIQPWEVSYNRIVQRFAHIIKGQFVGHTHTDELKVFYDINSKPINMAFNGASLTPYLKYNPNYKVVYVNPTSMDIVDIDTYSFNMTEANLYRDRTPAWSKLYSMKQAYNLPDLSPTSFDVFANRLLKDKKLQEQYWLNYVRKGDASLKDGCDDSCKMEVACKAVTTWSLHSVKPQCDMT